MVATWKVLSTCIACTMCFIYTLYIYVHTLVVVPDWSVTVLENTKMSITISILVYVRTWRVLLMKSIVPHFSCQIMRKVLYSEVITTYICQQISLVANPSNTSWVHPPPFFWGSFFAVFTFLCSGCAIVDNVLSYC